MELLLDTHAFLWYITADPKLPNVAHIVSVKLDRLFRHRSHLDATGVA